MIHTTHIHTHHTCTQGAVVAPSEEDSQTFSVNGANGEIYKLRAVDAKERQYWVSRLRNEVEHCTNQSFGTPVKEVRWEEGRGRGEEVRGKVGGKGEGGKGEEVRGKVHVGWRGEEE